MPTATTGQKLKSIDRTSNFLRVKGEGQKVLLRFASNDYAYEGKHIREYFDETTHEKKYEIKDCPKINEELECEKCDKYYELIKPNRELKAQQKATTDEAEKARLEVQINEVRKKARPYQVKITFYYPVLKRAMNYGEQPEAAIFQTSLQVRQKLEESQSLGYEITDFDFTILCTGKLPNYYIVDRLDSSRTKALDDKEQALLKEAKAFDLGRLLEGKKVHEGAEKEEDVEEETEEEVVTTPTSPAPTTTSKEEDSNDEIPF